MLFNSGVGADFLERVDPVDNTENSINLNTGHATDMVASAGYLYTVDPNGSQDGAVVKWDGNGQQVGNGWLSSGGNLVDPTTIAFAGDNFVYVADRNAFLGQGAIFRIDPTSGAQVTISSPGTFTNPIGLAAK